MQLPLPLDTRFARSAMNFVTSMLTIYTYSDKVCQLSGNSSVVLSIAHFRLDLKWDDVNNANGKEKEPLLTAVQWSNFFPNEQNKIIVDAYEMIEGIKNLYKLERQNVDNNFQVVYDHSCRMAEKVVSASHYCCKAAASKQYFF